MPTWQTKGSLRVFIFCVFAIITTITNKYVLSILKFTYPTIFQSWQTGTIAFVLLTLHSTGYIELDLSINKRTLLDWFPATVFFTGMIYSGSVALSRLPIPVFCAIHYLSFIWLSVADTFIYRKTFQIMPIICLTFTGISSTLIASSDPKFDHMGYRWMMLHCLFTGLYMYTENTLSSLKLSEIDKIFYNTSFSIAILMAISVVTGELYKVLEFPFLYTRSFHIGCLASGVFGSVLGIQRTVLVNMEYKLFLPVTDSINKFVVSGLSLSIFEANYTVAMALSILIGLFSGLLYFAASTDGEPVKEQQIQIT